MILGTAAYMSPGQAKGKLTEQRADKWVLAYKPEGQHPPKELIPATDDSQEPAGYSRKGSAAPYGAAYIHTEGAAHVL